MPEKDVADGESFIDDDYRRIDMCLYRERQPYEHPARVGLNRLIDEVADIGKRFDLFVSVLDLLAVEAKDAPVQ